MQSVLMKIASATLWIIYDFSLAVPTFADVTDFSSPTQFQVCGEDSNFTRPNQMSQVNEILISQRYDSQINKIPVSKRHNNNYIVSRIAGRLYTADAIIFSQASRGTTYDAKLLSGMRKAKIEKWKCSESLGNKLADMTETGTVSQVVLFGYKIQSIQKKGSFYVMTVSDKMSKGIQYIDIDRKLNGKLKITTVSGNNLQLVNNPDGSLDFGSR